MDQPVFKIESKNNETLGFSRVIALPNETWPLDDAQFFSDLKRSRDPADLEIFLAFSSEPDGGISVEMDEPNKQVTLSYEKPASEVANLIGLYVSEILMVRGNRQNSLEDLEFTIKGAATHRRTTI